MKPDGADDIAFLILRNFVVRVLAPDEKSPAVYPGGESEPQSRILFLASDAGVGLELRQELKVIKSVISETPETLRVIEKLDVTTSDFFVALNKYHPRIFHFSGNMADSALLLTSTQGQVEAIPEKALVELLNVFRNDIRLVVLNACNSYRCARAVTDVIDCAIGVDGEISDSSAIVFSQAFYRAISFGSSAANAFKQGVAAIKFRPLGSHAEWQEDESYPELVCKKGIDAEKVFFAPSRKDLDQGGPNK